MNNRILVINPGSTSTKIAWYEGEKVLWSEDIEHQPEELKHFNTVYDQFEMRLHLVQDAVAAKGEDIMQLAAVVSRGGPFASVKSGAYEITKDMLDKMWNQPLDMHASNLGMAIAHKIASLSGIKAYIYDAVTVDEMIPLTRIVGLKEMSRRGQGHNLNMRASALRLCRENNWDYNKKNILVAHLGGGITFSLHNNGRIVDMISDDEGAFSPERAGGLPGFQLIALCYSGKFSQKEMMRHVQRKGGLISLLGTHDARQVEERIIAGDAEAKLVYEALALDVARNLAKLSVVVNGNIDAIVLTGGIARSKMLTGWISERVKFIAPVTVLAGENEMEALALGALRVLEGKEQAHIYQLEEIETGLGW